MDESKEDKAVASVSELIDKAEKSTSADEALKFSQAACNSANALRALQEFLVYER